MAKLIERPSTYGHTPQPNQQIDIRDADWIGRYDFADLGDLAGCTEVQLPGGSVSVGMFYDVANKHWFAASVVPRAIGDSTDEIEALRAWFREVLSLRELARTIQRPAAPETEAQIRALTDAFGSL